MVRERNYQTEKKWVHKKASKGFDSLVFSAAYAKLLSARGIHNDAEAEEYVNPKYEALSDPFSIPDMDKACEVFEKAVREGAKIAIYGDYDVDGVTATALLTDFFEKIGVTTTQYIPSRIDEGYGLNREALDKLKKQGVDLIITVDCGSSSFDEAEYAGKIGLQLIITDHHTMSLEGGKIKLPQAAAVINPKRCALESPLHELAGVAVAFYFARAIHTKFTEILPLGQEKWLLDLVALGTICDIVPLIGENRILANYGLKVLKKSRRLGIQELSKASEINPEYIDSYKVGFLLGPRLNAAGRLEHARASLDLLLTEDRQVAAELAAKLSDLNLERQELTERLVAEATELIEKDGNKKSIYLLAGKDWPAGVVGIVASRLVDKYGKPMLVMEDMGEELRGSARSIDEFNIIEALTESGDLLTHFGGHAFAAGFSLEKDKFILLENKLISLADGKVNVEDLKPIIEIDMDVTGDEVTKQFCEEIALMEPFGRENGKPVFAIKNVVVAEARLVGNPPVHLKMGVQADGQRLNGIAFGYGEKMDIDLDSRYDLAVTLELNEWNNTKNPDFRLIGLQKSKND